MKRDPAQGVGIIVTMLLMGTLNSIAFQGLGAKEIHLSDPDAPFIFSNNVGLLLQIVMLPIMQCITNVNIYCSEKVIVVAEVKEGLYSTTAYTIASTLAMLPLMCIAIFVGMFVAWIISTGAVSIYIPFAKFLLMYVVGLMSYLALDSLFQFFSFLMDNAQAATGAAMLVFQFLGLFNGFAPSPSTYPVWLRWAIWVSPTYYSVALCVSFLFMEGDGGTDETKFLAEQYGFDEVGMEMWILFVCWIVVFRIFGAVALGNAKPAK
jgi:ABC-type multidrug transport system permease subunit